MAMEQQKNNTKILLFSPFSSFSDQRIPKSDRLLEGRGFIPIFLVKSIIYDPSRAN
jgi:hypothetical protein